MSDVNAVDYDKRTPLHIAVSDEQLEMTSYLLQCGANAEAIDRWGRSPIDNAMDTKNVAILRLLKRKHCGNFAVFENKSTSTDETGQMRRNHSNVDIKAFFQAVKGGEYRANGGHCPGEKQQFVIAEMLRAHQQKKPASCQAMSSEEEQNIALAFQMTKRGSCRPHRHCDVDWSTEFTLRVISRDPWLIGQVHCPVLDDSSDCVLVTHSLWQKNSSIVDRQIRIGIRTILKSGHIGKVFSGQHPEWLDLHAAQQSQFFLLPHARRAGIQTVVSAPMICKMSTIAVLSWSSDQAMSENQHELQRIQRVIRSVVILSTLRQELLTAASSSNIGVGRIPRFQYCQLLDNAITANGELTDSSVLREDLNVCDATPLALEWGLFDMVDTLATSMSSEDHAAVVPILRSLVMLLHNGLFHDALRDRGHGEHREHNDNSSLKHLVEECDGKIRTKWALLGHVKYYLQFLDAVSPTEAELFADVHELCDKIEQYVKEQSAGDGKTNDDSVSSRNTDEKGIDDGQTTSAPAESTPAAVPECVLCKYNVSGHIHPGREPIPATPASARTTPFQTKFSKNPQGEKLFGHPEKPKSPVYRQIKRLREKLEGEYDAFERKAALAECCDGAKPIAFTFSELYDAIGSAHDTPVTRRSLSADNSRMQLLGVTNEIMHDTSCVITRDHLFALHKCLLPASSGQAGVLRTNLAVGYASPRIYRVFLPAGEIEDALDNLIDTLNDASHWKHRPLLCAYYAFAVLVFYIHPFHDGNGRCARLLGNLVCKKLGFPALLRAADKTIQVAEFLQKAIVTMEIICNNRRQTRQTRMLSTRRENSSMWF
ncbi:unnamed protein product [Peronospora destructor]|uniref:Fido domain-containing protein n=1 Tax=Peronospora destructor TaxID=86335 RepID=A0AAV0UN47_9STRA|nr:unnamed protein product [Peronospora destructor]